MRIPTVRFLLGASAAAAIACSSPSQTAPSPPPSFKCEPFDYSSFDGQSPAVSFRADLLPIQRRACGFSSCHGALTSSKASMYLGPNLHDAAPDDSTIADIIATMKDASTTAPAVARVVPGDPQHSFLVLKLEGCQGEAGLTCSVQPGALTDNACGDPMPQPPTGQRLASDELDVYRRWIAQGEKDN